MTQIQLHSSILTRPEIYSKPSCSLMSYFFYRLITSADYGQF